MIEVKTADLIGPALDWAVAKAEGLDHTIYFYRYGGYWVVPVVKDGYNPERKVDWFSPSTDWSQGGPLIEKYTIALESADADPGADWRWNARFECDGAGHTGTPKCGSTPLIAACRAIVAAKLGDVVQVPAELLEKSPVKS